MSEAGADAVMVITPYYFKNAMTNNYYNNYLFIYLFIMYLSQLPSTQ